MKVSNQKDTARYEGFWLSETPPLRIMEVPIIKQRFDIMVGMVQTQPKLLKAFREAHDEARRSKECQP